MQDESVKHVSSLLSVRDYLTAVLQEYQALRQEIKLRINMRNGSMVAFGTCAAVIIGKILFAGEPFDPESYYVQIVLLGILPILWFLGLTIQVVLMAQVDRLGRVLAIIERKVQLVFELAGEKSVKRAIEELEIKLDSELCQIQNPKINFWSAPILWERFLRSRKCGRMVGFRWWDCLWRRNIPCFMAGTVLSSIGAVILAATGGLEWSCSLIWVGIYLAIAIILVLMSTRSTFVGPTATQTFAPPAARGGA